MFEYVMSSNSNTLNYIMNSFSTNTMFFFYVKEEDSRPICATVSNFNLISGDKMTSGLWSDNKDAKDIEMSTKGYVVGIPLRNVVKYDLSPVVEVRENFVHDWGVTKSLPYKEIALWTVANGDWTPVDISHINSPLINKKSSVHLPEILAISSTSANIQTISDTNYDSYLSPSFFCPIPVEFLDADLLGIGGNVLSVADTLFEYCGIEVDPSIKGIDWYSNIFDIKGRFVGNMNNVEEAVGLFIEDTVFTLDDGKKLANAKMDYGLTINAYNTIMSFVIPDDHTRIKYINFLATKMKPEAMNYLYNLENPDSYISPESMESFLKDFKIRFNGTVNYSYSDIFKYTIDALISYNEHLPELLGDYNFDENVSYLKNLLPITKQIDNSKNEEYLFRNVFSLLEATQGNIPNIVSLVISKFVSENDFYKAVSFALRNDLNSFPLITAQVYGIVGMIENFEDFFFDDIVDNLITKTLHFSEVKSFELISEFFGITLLNKSAFSIKKDIKKILNNASEDEKVRFLHNIYSLLNITPDIAFFKDKDIILFYCHVFEKVCDFLENKTGVDVFVKDFYKITQQHIENDYNPGSVYMIAQEDLYNLTAAVAEFSNLLESDSADIFMESFLMMVRGEGSLGFLNIITGFKINDSAEYALLSNLKRMIGDMMVKYSRSFEPSSRLISIDLLTDIELFKGFIDKPFEFDGLLDYIKFIVKDAQIEPIDGK